MFEIELCLVIALVIFKFFQANRVQLVQKYLGINLDLDFRSLWILNSVFETTLVRVVASNANSVCWGKMSYTGALQSTLLTFSWSSRFNKAFLFRACLQGERVTLASGLPLHSRIFTFPLFFSFVEFTRQPELPGYRLSVPVAVMYTATFFVVSVTW